MKHLLEYCRTILVSFEFIIIASFMVVSLRASTVLDPIREQIQLSDDANKWFALVPAGLLTLVFKDVRKILFPEKDTKNALHAWVEYHNVRVICNVSLLYGVIFLLFGVTSWVLAPEYKSVSFLLSVTSILGASTTFITTHLAEIRINEEFALWQALNGRDV